MGPRTIAYVDGFNLYYGALKGTQFKWLDIYRLCELLCPHHSITRLRYFSAMISSTPQNPDGHVRQQAYLRALATNARVSIHMGRFLRKKAWRPLVVPPPQGNPLAEVWLMEEKGSDVSLATFLVHDAHEDEFDCAIVVSNDSDLLEPIRLVRGSLGKQVGLLNPHKRPAIDLQANCDFLKRVRQGPLGAAQFPMQLQDANGTIHKPALW